ncbi:MAG: uroporphyrinogen-III C-methyltransferase [Azoarcus sp.]|nr:uroporphyrinogen-III C-methyltransferase [Azoarcus sp.]
MKEENPALVQPPSEAPQPPVTQDGAASDHPADAVGPTRSTSSAPPAPPAAPAPVAPAARSGGGAGWAVLLAVLALAGAGFAVWQAWELRGQADSLRGEVANRLSAGETIATEVRAISRQQQESIASLQGKLGALESKVEATEGQAAALETLYQQFSRSQEDGVVAEVEQAVTIAAQQLQLAGNVEAALIALQGAEARLAMQDRGQLAPLRRAIASDIDQLRQQAVVDVPGIALRLERLLERTDTLPLAFAGEAQAGQVDQPGPTAESSGVAALDFVTQLALDVWRDLRTLVRVERLDQAAEPVLLAPAQSTFLRENLKIRLLTARLALLARDGRTYTADLAQARGWIERFFDIRDERVLFAISELSALEAMPVTVERHGLNESFAALRLLQSRRTDVPGRPVTGDTPMPVSPAPAAEVPAANTPVTAPQN